MTSCPTSLYTYSYTEFIKSWCALQGDPREYNIECVDPSHPEVQNGFHFTRTESCAQHEVCETYDDPEDESRSMAYCVRQEPKLALLEASRDYSTRKPKQKPFSPEGSKRGSGIEASSGYSLRRATAHFNQPSTSGVNFMLTLTGQTDSLFNASEIRIVPRDGTNDTIAPPISCHECAHLSFPKSPPDTDNFDMNITLPDIHDVVNLYTFAYNA